MAQAGQRIGMLVLAVWMTAAPLRPQGVITTLVGTEWIFPGGARPALDSPLGRVSSIAVDRSGALCLADPDNSMVARIGSDGILRVIAGNGLNAITGDDLPATATALAGPTSIAFDSAGNLFVAHFGRIRKVSVDGIITAVAGGNRLGFAGDGGPAKDALLNGLIGGMVFDAAGNLLISDSNNHRIRRIAPNGIITTIAGTGQAASTGDGGQAASASLHGPQGIAIDSKGAIYIAEFTSNRVRKIASNGIISTLLQRGGVLAVTVDAADNLFFAPGAGVERLNPDGTTTKIAGGGLLESDGIPATSALLRGVTGLAFDAARNLYIADANSDRVRKVTAGGVFSTIAGNGRFRFAPDGSPAASASLHAPNVLALDASNNVFVLETGRPRLRRVAPSGRIFSVAGEGRRGNTPDGQQALTASFNLPSGIAIEPSGSILLGDDVFIRRISRDGILSTFARSSVSNVGTIVRDPQGNVYFVESSGIRSGIQRASPAGVVTPVIPLGPPGFSGDGGPASAATVNFPQGLAIDPAGNLVFSDTFNHRIRRIAANGTVSTIVGTGQPGFAGDGQQALTAQLNAPWGVTFDAAGNLYIADLNNYRVRRVTPAGVISTVGGGGDSSADGILATQAFIAGRGIAVDGPGNIYIADSASDRVRVILAIRPAAAATPVELSFAGSAGGAPLPTQNVRLASSVAGSLFTAVARTATGGAWLVVSPARGVMPAALQVRADPQRLTPGTYEGTVEIASPATNPTALSISVRFVVEEEAPPRLAVRPDSLAISALQQSPPQTQAVSVVNEGGGSAQFSAVSNAPWLTVSPEQGVATSTAPVSLDVSVNPASLPPGTYSALITLAEAGGDTIRVPVTLTVTPVEQNMLLSERGLLFWGVLRGGAVPSQTFGVVNTGSGVMSWSASASTLPGGANWLSVSPASGVADAASPLVPLVEVSVNPAGLAPAEYYGLVRVTSPRAVNSPQLVSIAVNILPEGSDPGPVVRPSSLIFTGAAAGAPIASQEVFVSNLSAAAATYTSGRITSDGGTWLQHLPTDATVEPGRPTRIVVQPDVTGLGSGIHRATLTLQFGGGLTRTVNVLLLLAPGAASISGGRSAAGCAPTALLPQFTGLEGDFSIAAGWPAAMSLRVVDTCGDPMTSGSVVLTFSNGDPPLPMASLKDGRWSGTWQARGPSTARVTITATAQQPGGGLRGTAQVSGGLRIGGSAPAIASGGVVSTASFATTPAAPGGLVSIFGSNLAGSVQQSPGLPLAAELDGTSALIAGRVAPLYFVAPGQINAVIPYDVAVNARHQLIVTKGTAISVPESVAVAAAQPGILTKDQSGKGQGLIFAVTEAGAFLAEPGSPARAGASLVLYCAGLGALDQPVREGAAAPFDPLARTGGAVTLTAGGVEARVFFAGLTPGFAGLYQVNAVLPAGLAPSDAVPVVLTIAGQSSPPVTMAVQ